MIARIAVWEPMPDDDRQWVIDAAKRVPGVLHAYHLVDPSTGNGPSVSFFEDTVDGAAVKAAIEKKASEIGWNADLKTHRLGRNARFPNPPTVIPIRIFDNDDRDDDLDDQ